MPKEKKSETTKNLVEKEEKKENTELKKEVDSESTKVIIDKNNFLDEVNKNDKQEAKTDNADLLDDLPESVKKKLEQTKSDKKAKKKKAKKKKKQKRITTGKAFVKATYNNTIVTITDDDGNTIASASAGMAGFKGPKKSTSYAGQIITKIAVQKAKEIGLETVVVYVKGIGTGREAAIRALNSAGLNISTILDVTPIPHNGCRAKKPRRI